MGQDGGMGIRIYRLVYAGIWLVFLSLPVAYALRPETPSGWRITALVTTAAFILLYLWIFWRSRDTHEVTADARWTVAAVVVLGLLAAASVPAAGYAALSFVPFLSAVLVFTLPLRSGLLSGTLVWLVACLLSLPFADTLWPVFGTGMGVLFIVVIRLADNFEQRQLDAEEELRRAAERDSIARDVHDVLGHSLTVLSIRAQLARRLIDHDPAQAREEVDRIDSLARESLAQVRSTVNRLRTPRLVTELEAVREALTAAGITAEVIGDAAPDSRHAELFAWALRETVTNVVRHSQASRCVIQVGPDQLRVQDDGVGLACAGGPEGHGLRGLRERAAVGGATLHIGPAADGAERPGTVVEVSLR
ncbi:sensor histidine kinase [Nesterenkonia sp. HG001]|uniref:sensor histidine kinase n=1 Tax=Nesterenkonia sp. HG001 TaxID=2983207 RepID=UPI002AC7A7CC|nr:histidine kinase [Nesterenkonia sp. HG001]MDZ5078747.1 histidine kinase [Nesterenkonia sp. HG001]